MREIDVIWFKIIDYGIASQKELELITKINGDSIETLNSVICARSACHDIEQYEKCELQELLPPEYIRIWSNMIKCSGKKRGKTMNTIHLYRGGQVNGKKRL